jgi:polyadenylate-binding protein
VKGLPKEWSHQDLWSAFEKFGKVISAKVSVDPEFNSRQYGFIQLDSESAMLKAIEEMNDHEVDGSKLTVCEFVPKTDRLGTSKPRCSTNLYVKNFPQTDFTED